MKSTHPVFSDEMKEIVRSFVVETQEIFDDLNNHLLRLEQVDDTRPIIDEIFRAVHTVKGTSGFLNLDQLTLLTHRFEDVLNRLRHRSATIEPGTMDVMFAAFDVMNVLLQQVLDGAIEEIPMDGLLQDLQLLARDRSSGDGAFALSDPDSNVSTPRFDQFTPAEDAATRSRTSDTVRIGVDRIDDLIGLAGELAAERDHIARIVEDLRIGPENPVTHDELAEAIARLSTVTHSIHSAVVLIRMVPVGTVFSRFHRVARDLARELGKEVELHVEGAETELDRLLIDEIADPLLHLVRNAVDHGIEAPFLRSRSDKPVPGRIVLRAEPVEGGVLLTIEDDGIGIDVAALRRRAAESGFGSEREIAAMSPAGVRNLIFQPGFTAHEKANRISGRGIGLDVVKTSIERLGGSVRVESEPGRYTRFSVRLPRITIIQRCLLVECGASSFAIPSYTVASLLSEPDVVITVRGAVVRYAGADVPLLDMAAWLAATRDPSPKRQVVLLRTADGIAGLIVDRVRSERELVVTSKPADATAGDGFLGSARLGSGHSVGVLDVGRLLQLVRPNGLEDDPEVGAGR